LKVIKKLKKLIYRDYFNPKLKVRKRLGLRLLLRYQNYIDRKLILREPYESRQLNLLSRAAEESKASLFIDVGANIGLYSVYLARHVTGLEKVYAMEPQPENFNQLCGNIFTNNLSHVILPIRKGASNKPTRLVFLENKGRSTGKSRLADTAPTGTKLEEFRETFIEVVAMDSVLSEEKGRVAVIKVDVEGHETQVLEGMREFLGANSCLLQIEILGEQAEKEKKLSSICGEYDLTLLAEIESDCYLTNDTKAFPRLIS